MSNKNKIEWLLLIHQIPPKPDYFRVKIWRRLQKVGAVSIKQSVYVLPDNEQSHEDLHWIVNEITGGGGIASLSKAVFLEGISNAQIESLFQTARENDYEKIVLEVQDVINDSTESKVGFGSSVLKKKRELSRIKNKFSEIVAIDFFNAPGRKDAELILFECQELLKETDRSSIPWLQKIESINGRTWVTREGVFVDRIASAWLIRRFIDPTGEVKVVSDKKYQPLPDELRFDMFEGEFSHIGDKCSFEVLVDFFGLEAHPINVISEIVHDIDLKDKKYGRPEMNGVLAIFSGMAASQSDDQIRFKRGFTILDELYASLGGKIKK